MSFGIEVKYAVRTLIQGCERNSPYTRTKQFIHGANEIIKLTKHQIYVSSHFNPLTILPRFGTFNESSQL